MPPLLLPRHLRPCHMPWSARQACPAPNVSTAGGDTVDAKPWRSYTQATPSPRPAATFNSRPSSANGATLGRRRVWRSHSPRIGRMGSGAGHVTKSDHPGPATHGHKKLLQEERKHRDVETKAALEQQLQQLLEQVQILQNKIDDGTSSKAEPPAFGPNRLSLKSKRNARRAFFLSHAHQPSPLARSGRVLSFPSSISASMATRRHRTIAAFDIVRRAEKVYREGVLLLIYIAAAADRLSPVWGPSLAALAEGCLARTGQMACTDGDLHIVSIMERRYDGRFKHLLGDKPPAARVQKQYRTIIGNLAETTRETEKLRFPKASAVATSMRQRLLAISEEAQKEKDIAIDNAVASSPPCVSASVFPRTNNQMEAHTNKSEEHAVHIVDPSHSREKQVRAVQSSRGSSKFKNTTLNREKQNMLAHVSSQSSAVERATQGTLSQPILRPEDHSVAQSGGADEVSEQTLLEELFPEASSSPLPKTNRLERHKKLNLPCTSALAVPSPNEPGKSPQERMVDSFQQTGEKITVLMLEDCSTELTEADFRRLIPKGQHIESWNRAGEFYKVIPGRDALSLERLPFYYLLFNRAESALAYQKNASRLHKLVALHRSSSLYSAIPPPRGFIEDGEDINFATKSYLLAPPELPLKLRVLMQPYHPALRALLEQGGYRPIMPNISDKGKRIYKVLLHIEGYEPSHTDLFKTLSHEAWKRGISIDLLNESASSIRRLRDVVKLKSRITPISTTNPQPADSWEKSDPTSILRGPSKLHFEDATIDRIMGRETEDEGDTAQLNQMVMNRVYNRWVIDFDDEDAARRFAVMWHRVELAHLPGVDKTWKDHEEARVCNTELLW